MKDFKIIERNEFLSIDLYQQLLIYGDIYNLSVKLDDPDKFVQWTEDNFHYVKYNPRKKITIDMV